MIKAVLDTNVFVSAVFWRGSPYELLRKGIIGEFTIITSAAIIQELQKTLVSKFSFPAEETRDFLTLIAVHSIFAEPTDIPRVVLSDTNDDKIIACAVAGEAPYVVTGDKHLLTLKRFRDIDIITPVKFISLLTHEGR